jgi:hypothetical protein
MAFLLGAISLAACWKREVSPPPIVQITNPFIAFSSQCILDALYPQDSLVVRLEFTNRSDRLIPFYPEKVMFFRKLPRYYHSPYLQLATQTNKALLDTIPALGTLVFTKKIKLDTIFFNQKNNLFEFHYHNSCADLKDTASLKYCGNAFIDTVALNID